MKHYSGKDKKQLTSIFPSFYEVDKKDEIIESSNVIFKEKIPFIIKIQDKSNPKQVTYVPHLKSTPITQLKTVTIDVGAVPFLLKGANMMRPGITQIDETIEEGELIVVIDEVKNLRIGVAKALFSGAIMKSMDSGKVLETLHYFKDQYYNTTL